MQNPDEVPPTWKALLQKQMYIPVQHCSSGRKLCQLHHLSPTSSTSTPPPHAYDTFRRSFLPPLNLPSPKLHVQFCTCARERIRKTQVHPQFPLAGRASPSRGQLPFFLVELRSRPLPHSTATAALSTLAVHQRSQGLSQWKARSCDRRDCSKQSNRLCWDCRVVSPRNERSEGE